MKLHFSELSTQLSQETPATGGSNPAQVHIWTHLLGPYDPFVAHARFILSKEELEKASRYHFEKDRKTYESGHVFIRRVLSRYTDIEAANIEISSSNHHKPTILNSSENINFNISHSESFIILAIGFNIDVGVDTEFISPDFDTDGFAEANFHPNELAEFKKLTGGSQTDFFYKIWTMKEAFLKLTGEGINDHLKDIDFSGKTSFLEYQGDTPDDIWQYTWNTNQGYSCSLACNQQVNDFKFYESKLIEPVINENY